MRTDDLEWPAGADWAVQWPVTPDPTGGTVRAQVRAYKASPDVLHEWTTADTTATADANGVTLIADAADSAAWTWEKGYYDVLLTMPDGGKYRVAEGTVTVSLAVTR